MEEALRSAFTGADRVTAPYESVSVGTSARLHFGFLDPSGRRGAARSIYDQIRDAIESGVLGEGDPLPPSRELAAELGVSRHTVTTAYGLLVAEGYLAGRAGGGTAVCRTATGRRSADRRSH